MVLINHEGVSMAHWSVGMGVAVWLGPLPALVVVVMMRIGVAVKVFVVHGVVLVLQHTRVFLRPQGPADQRE